MVKLGAAELRTTKSTDEERKKIKKNPIYIILDNVMDTYNIGSIFRLAKASEGQAKLKIIAIEQDKKSIPDGKADYGFPIALVVGHETEGVSKEVLEIADQIVEIPMWGVNKSLNVIVSLGI